jgi:hypothetical protein
MLQFCRGQAAAALAVGEPLSLAFYNAVLAKLANLGAWQSSAALLEFMRVCIYAVLCTLQCNTNRQLNLCSEAAHATACAFA